MGIQTERIKRKSDIPDPNRREKHLRNPLVKPNGVKCNAGRCDGMMFIREIEDEMHNPPVEYYRCNRPDCIFHAEPVLAIERCNFMERWV